MDDLSNVTSICCKEKDSSKTFQICTFLNCHTESERNAISTLIQVSAEISEEDGKLVDYPFRTGWEEAVHGWERASPFACLYPQKKPKKSKKGEVYHCTLCIDLAQVLEEKKNMEIKSAVEYSGQANMPLTKAKVDMCELGAQNLSHCTDGEELNTSEMQNNVASSYDESTISGEQDKSDIEVYLVHPCQGDVKPFKEEDIKHQEKSHTYSMMRLGGKKTAKKGLEPMNMSRVKYFTKANRAFSSFAVLPPLKAVVPNDFLDFSVKKNKTITAKNEEKTQYKASAGIMGHSHARGLQMQENEATPHTVADALRKQLRGENVIPAFVPLDPRTQILTDKECRYGQCSLMPAKTSSVISNAGISKPPNSASSRGLLHPGTIQYSKRNGTRDKLSRTPLSISGISNNGSEQRRNRLRRVAVPVPLVPELSITRIAIRAVPSRVL